MIYSVRAWEITCNLDILTHLELQLYLNMPIRMDLWWEITVPKLRFRNKWIWLRSWGKGLVLLLRRSRLLLLPVIGILASLFLFFLVSCFGLRVCCVSAVNNLSGKCRCGSKGFEETRSDSCVKEIVSDCCWRLTCVGSEWE